MPRHFTLAILLVALVLRVALAGQGGQYFFGDEGRYDRSIELYRALTHADFSAAAQLAAQPEHTLFTWLGVLVAGAHHALAQFTPFGDWDHHPEFAGFTIWLAAAVLSLASVLNLALLHRLARVAGAGTEEANWALLLMAAANTAFYHARHLLPYDCALTAALAALVCALGPPSIRRTFAAGLLTGATYHLYNGYWFLVPVIAATVALAWRPAARPGRFTFLAFAGLALGLLGPLAFGAAIGGANYWSTLGAFSRSVTQGLFSEGWSLPWKYLWHSEGILGVAVIALVVGALVQVLRAGELLPARIRGTVFATLAAYTLLVIGSCVLARFVVYGRTTKPLVPALCLLGGWALARQLAPRPVLKPFAAAALVLAAAFQFWPHFTRVFPRETEVAILRHWGNPKRALTVSGSIYTPLALPVARPDLALVNAQMLYPVRSVLDAPAGLTLLRFDHPLAYPPFQYEGHTPRERTLLRGSDIAMRLVRLTHPGAVPDDPPPSTRFGPADRPSGR